MIITLLSTSSDARTPYTSTFPRQQLIDSAYRAAQRSTDERKARLKVLDTYNRLVEKEAHAILDGTKDQAKAAKQKRLTYLDSLKAKGIPLPLKVATTKRLNVDEILKRGSDSPDYQRPSELKKRQDSVIEVNDKFARDVTANISPDQAKRLGALRPNQQKSAMKELKYKLANLRNEANTTWRIENAESNHQEAKKHLEAFKKRDKEYKASANQNPKILEKMKQTHKELVSDVLLTKKEMDKAKVTAERAKEALTKLKTPEGKKEVLSKIMDSVLKQVESRRNLERLNTRFNLRRKA